MKKRYSVLTYNIGNYEVIHEIEQMDSEAEYIMVTDNKDLSSNTWSVIVDPDLEGLSTFDKCYKIRFNCFKYCSTDICVRIDGSMGLKLSLKPLIDIFESGNYDICLMPHPHRDNIIEEYEAWINGRNYNRAQAERCIAAMRSSGYDFNYKGLFQYGFAIEKKCQQVLDLDKKVYKMLVDLGINGDIERLDQTIFTFVINHYYSNLKVLPISSQILSSAYLQIYMHGGNSYNLYHMPDFRKDDVKYLFNQKVNCLYMPTPLNREVVKEREYILLRDLFFALEDNNKLTKLCSSTNIIKDKNRKHIKAIRILSYITGILTILTLCLILKLFIL